MTTKKEQTPSLPEKEEHASELKGPRESSRSEQSEPTIETAMEALQKEVSHLKDQLLRSLAETENLRKRTQREKEEMRQYAISSFARELLSIADNLDRALQALSRTAEEETSVAFKSFKEGVELTQRELEATFNRQGIKKISPLGEKFDHNFHQAMLETESNDQEAGRVTQVLQDGYVIQERLLRPALVAVAKAKTQDSREEENKEIKPA
jgi:molecular chaperone GrpE